MERSPNPLEVPAADDGQEDVTVDLVVVGGGLAGLCAAATAARGGLRVVVLEQRDLGGRAAVTTVDPGVVFNAGPRAFYNGGPGEAALAALDISVRGGTPDSAYSYGVLDGALHRLPAGPLTLLRTRLLSARSKFDVGRMLATLDRIDPSKCSSVSIDGWMREAGLRDDAVALMRTVLRTATYSAEVETFSADAALRQLQLALGPGVRYVDGGFAQIVAALRDAAVAAGAAVVDHEAVRSIELAGRHPVALDPVGFEPAGPTIRWTVHTSTQAIAARSVLVATGGPDAVERLLPVPLDRSGIGAPVTAACLELAVRRPPDLPLLLAIDEPLYLSRHTPAAAGLAPDGITVVHVMRYGARTSDEDRRDLWAHAALAGLHPRDVVAERFLHRMVVTGGLPLAATGGLTGRPPVEVRGAEALYIAGDWVGHEGLLADAALASGRRAAQLAIDRLARLAAEPAAPQARAGAR